MLVGSLCKKSILQNAISCVILTSTKNELIFVFNDLTVKRNKMKEDFIPCENEF